jgi:general L-amino acid transport system permease protein
MLVVGFILLQGLSEAVVLPNVSTNVWGGLLLTMILSVAGILLSFPLGVALAVGRRSDMPVVKWLSTAYIELIRAVPLITILFMAALMFPLFLPEGIRIDNVFRAIGGITIFSAAYVAENVRGGLQAIPRGQVEAAQAIGLRSWQTNVFIVLPQALRITIPSNVGLFISLLKDTTLVAIIGLLELLGIGRAVLAQPEWIGTAFEVYLFIAVVFFVLSYALSQASYRLEKELGIGER